MAVQGQARRERLAEPEASRELDGRGFKKLDDDLMRTLIQKGMTNAEIVRWYASEDRDVPMKITAAAVSIWKARHGFPTRKPTKERLALIPWKVKSVDTRHRIYQGLAAEARRRAGRELDEPTRKRREKLLREMSELGDENGPAVAHYDQVTGWSLVRRRPDIDEDLIRDPRIANDGTPIEDPKKWQ